MFTQRPSVHTPLLLAGFLSFLLLGLIQSNYGLAFAPLRQRFGLDAAQVGAITGAHFLGATLGPLLVAFLQRYASERLLMLIGAACLCLGLLGIAYAPAWALVLLSAGITGLGYGFFSAGFNSAFGLLGPQLSNLINAFFGLGSVGGPLLGLALGFYPTTFVVLAGLVFLIALSIWPSQWPQQKQELAAAPLNWLALLPFGTLIYFYSGFELGIGGWIASYMQALTLPNAALLTSLYWLSLTVGRFMVAAFGNNVKPERLVLFAALLCLLSTIMLNAAALLPVTLVLAGLSAAPIFPTTLAWLLRDYPAQAAPYMLTIGSLAAATLPLAIGVLFKFNVYLWPLGMTFDALLLVVTVLWTMQQEKKRPVL